MQLRACGVQQHEARTGGADRRVVDLAIALETVDVGERHRFDPADAGADAVCTGVQSIETSHGRISEVSTRAETRGLAESECESRPTGVHRARLPFCRACVRGEVVCGGERHVEKPLLPRRRVQFEVEQKNAGAAVVQRVRHHLGSLGAVRPRDAVIGFTLQRGDPAFGAQREFQIVGGHRTELRDGR